MKTLLVICIALNFFGSLAAQTISLKHDKTGKVFGPFEITEGSKVVLGKATFTVVNVADAEPGLSPLMKILDEVTVPRTELRNANPVDCVAYVNDYVESLNPVQPVNIVCRNVNVDPFNPNIKTVSLSMKSVSALRLLEEICSQTDLQIKEVKGVLVVSPQE